MGRHHLASDGPATFVKTTACAVAPGQQRRSLTLFLLDHREIRFVTSIFHLFDGNEMKGGGVNNVASAGRRLRVGKDMTKARVTSLGAHLGPLHFVCVVG